MKTVIELTYSARAHAGRLGVAERVHGLPLGEWTARGDLVTLEGEDQATFIVHARRIEIAPDGTAALVLILDYPPRPAGR